MTRSVELHYLTMLMQYFRSVEIYSPTKKPSKSLRVVFKRFERPIKYSAVLFAILLLYFLFIGRENSQIKNIQGRILNLANKSPESVKIDDNGTVHLSDGLILPNGRTAKIQQFIRELNLTNPGAGGDGVFPDEKLLTTEHRRLIQEGSDEYGCNTLVSDMVGLNRFIADNRSDYCKQKHKTYRRDLPKASVIIAFHNSAWSVLLRTVHSVLINSPPHLIEEIVLADDYSTKEHLGRQLDEYVKTLKKVKIVRSQKRLGVVGTRILAVRNAKGPVIISLDSHVEVTNGWLEPLLDRVSDNPTLVVWPKVHGSNKNSFGVGGFDESVGTLGGVDFAMNFVPLDRIYPRDPKISKYEPWKSPTVFGPTFVLWKRFFEHIGYMDIEFDHWGGDDIELSFKTWMCGGSIELIPCSVTIHLYRDHKYKHESKGKGGYRWNTDRLAETWLDDNYKKYYYRLNGNTKNRNYGDISDQLKHKEKIGCKSFTWYVENVHPELGKIPEDLRDEKWIGKE